MRGKKSRNAKPVLGWGNPHGWLCSGMARRGFIPFLGRVFSTDAPAKNQEHDCKAVSNLGTFCMFNFRGKKPAQRSKLQRQFVSTRNL